MQFDFSRVLAENAPAPAARWSGFAEFNFVGGHVDEATVPVDDLRAAVDAVLAREGSSLALYKMYSGPQGYEPLRAFVAKKLRAYAGIEGTADDILLTSGSLQSLELINDVILSPGDTVVVEESNYGGVLTDMRRRQVTMVPVPLDGEGMRMDALEEALAGLKARGVRPKFIYTIPTVHNPTGTILPEDRRRRMLALAAEHDLPIVEDDCYADLIWANARPPALRALDQTGRVIHVGTFSKTIAPALRVGYIAADWPIMARLLAAKTDAGSGALEQMMLGEYCPAHFDAHLSCINKALEAKLDVLTSALDEQFGTSVSYTRPPGGIYLWVKLPEGVETARLARVAATEGVAINPGPEWSLGEDRSQWARICFANPPVETIRAGIERLAEICHQSFGAPEISANRRR
jgi:2-aminoadipate transaminase